MCARGCVRAHASTTVIGKKLNACNKVQMANKFIYQHIISEIRRFALTIYAIYIFLVCT